MNADTYEYRKAQFAKLSDPAPYSYGIKLYGKGEPGWTNQFNVTAREYDRVKDVLLDDWTDSFRLVIRTGNSAFDDKNSETAHILRYLADRIEGGFTDFPNIQDHNGNDVGEASFY
jgi:hypothetical protein